MIGCCPASFSRLAASVENPVFVFFCGASPSSSNSTSRSCSVEFTLKSWPAASTIAARWRSTSATSRSRRRCSSSRSTATPASSIRASTPTSGTSISSLSVRRPCASRAASSGCDQTVDGQGAAGGGGGRRRGGAVEVELALRGGVAVGDAGAGVADQELLEQVPALGRVEEVGRERGVECQAAHVDVEARERAHERLGLVGDEGAAVGPGQRRRARRAPRRRRAAAPGSHTTSPAAAVAHEGEALEVGPSLGARPRRPRPRAGRCRRRGAASTFAAPAASAMDVDLRLEHLGLGRRRARGRCRPPQPAGRRAC